MKINPIEPIKQKQITFTGYFPQSSSTTFEGHFPGHYSVKNPEPSSNQLSAEALIALTHLNRPVPPSGTGILLDVIA